GVEIAEISTGPTPNLGCLTASILPVEMTTFEAETLDKGVALTWTTASEVNARGFSLERKYENGSFAEIAFLNAKGATGGEYSYTDKSPEKAGVYTYRLKQVDRDGSFRYVGTVEVTYEAPLTFALEQNFPNPFNPTTTIRYELAKDVNVKLVVYNSIGEQVATLVDGQQAAGRYDASFNASNFASGIYFYRLEAGDFVDVKRMALLK
ncbi:MAG: T9SS type A sorting domain-containing protein, partial [Ignavibacteriales bacterium]|nr:T9SS type A sorting domain-containing protein [Ignavibacteriales bacterium]